MVLLWRAPGRWRILVSLLVLSTVAATAVDGGATASVGQIKVGPGVAIKAAAHIANAMGMGEATATMETMELARSVSESESAGLRDDVDDDLLGNGTTSETDKDKGFIHDYGTYIGASISIFGNLCISAALNLQKFAHNSIAEGATKDRGEPGEVEKENYLCKPMWWAGIILMVFGELGNFGAYFFAPASLVAPLGTVTVISNAIIAPCCLGEKIRRRDLGGMVFAVLGAGVIVACAPSSEDQLTTKELYEHCEQIIFVCYASFLVASGIAAYVLLRLGKGETYLLIPLYITAVLGSFTVLSVKAISSLLLASFAGVTQFDKPLIYCVAAVLIFTAVTQVRFLNYAMQHFDSTEVVPTFFVMFTLGAILIGAIYYDDFHDLSNEKRAGFFAGVCSTFFGVYLITSKRDSAGKYDTLVNEGDSAAAATEHRTEAGQSRHRLHVPLLGGENRSRSPSGSSLSGLSPLLGIETTPLVNRPPNASVNYRSRDRSRLHHVQNSVSSKGSDNGSSAVDDSLLES